MGSHFAQIWWHFWHPVITKCSPTSYLTKHPVILLMEIILLPYMFILNLLFHPEKSYPTLTICEWSPIMVRMGILTELTFLERILGTIQGDPNQNFPFSRLISLKVSTPDPKLVKPKLVWEVAVFSQQKQDFYSCKI